MKKDRQIRFSKEDAFEVYRNTTANKTLQCSGVRCKTIRALRMGIERPGSYFMVLQFNLSQDVHDNIQAFEFSARTLSSDFSYLSIAVKLVLLVASVVNAVLFYLDMRRAERLRVELLFEQSFLKYLNLALVMFFDPVNIYHSYRSSSFT